MCRAHLKAETGPYVDAVMSFCIEYLRCWCAVCSLEYLCMFATIKDYQQMNAQNIKENIQQFSKHRLKILNTAAFEY